MISVSKLRHRYLREGSIKFRPTKLFVQNIRKILNISKSGQMSREARSKQLFFPPLTWKNYVQGQIMLGIRNNVRIISRKMFSKSSVHLTEASVAKYRPTPNMTNKQ